MIGDSFGQQQCCSTTIARIALKPQLAGRPFAGGGRRGTSGGFKRPILEPQAKDLRELRDLGPIMTGSGGKAFG